MELFRIMFTMNLKCNYILLFVTHCERAYNKVSSERCIP